MDEALDFLRGRLDSLIEADRLDLIRGGVHIGGGDRTARHRRRLRIYRLPRGARIAQSSRLARPINCCGSCAVDFYLDRIVKEPLHARASSHM